MFKFRITILLIILFIGGIALTVSGISDIIKLSKVVPDFNYDSMSDVKSGDFVHGELVFIYDCYAGETTTETTMGIKTSSYTSREYFIMPLINEKDYEKDMYISVSAAKEADRNMLYDLGDKTWEYMSEGNEDIVWPEDTYVIMKVNKLDPELMEYMKDWFEGYFDEGESVAAHIFPYDLVIFDPGSSYISLVVGIIMLIIPIIVAMVFLHSVHGTKRSSASGNGDSFTGYSSAAPTMESVGGSGGFSEASFAQSPYIPQPVQPDEFFQRTEKKADPPEEKPAEPKPEPSPAPVNYSDEIDTSSLDTDSLGYMDEDDPS